MLENRVHMFTASVQWSRVPLSSDGSCASDSITPHTRCAFCIKTPCSIHAIKEYKSTIVCDTISPLTHVQFISCIQWIQRTTYFHAFHFYFEDLFVAGGDNATAVNSAKDFWESLAMNNVKSFAIMWHTFFYCSKMENSVSMVINLQATHRNECGWWLMDICVVCAHQFLMVLATHLMYYIYFVLEMTL